MFIINGITNTVPIDILIVALWLATIICVILAVTNLGDIKFAAIPGIIAVLCFISVYFLIDHQANKVELESREFVRYFISESYLLENTNVGDNEFLVMMYNEKVKDLNEALEYAQKKYGQPYNTYDPMLFELKPLELIEVI